MISNNLLDLRIDFTKKRGLVSVVIYIKKVFVGDKKVMIHHKNANNDTMLTETRKREFLMIK